MTKAIDEIIKTIEDHKEENYDQLNTEKLLEYLYAVKGEDENTNLAQEDRLQLTRYESECALHQQQYQAQCASSLEMFKSIMLSSQNALRTGLLINGGAAIAVLAFIGNIVNTHGYMLTDLAVALVWFASGTLVVGISAFLAYIVQRIYSKSKDVKDIWHKVGNYLNGLIVVLGFVAIMLFCAGAFYSYKGITSKKQPEKNKLSTNDTNYHEKIKLV